MRDHIEFVQAQRLPWQDGAAMGLHGCEIKYLSEDRGTGAFSAVVRYPAGLARAGGGARRR